MGKEETTNDISNLSVFHKWIIVLALGAGAGNGFMGLNQDTADRYKAAEAAADFASRDARIRSVEDRINEHLKHSATYTQIIRHLKEDFQDNEALIKEHVSKHMDGRRGYDN